MRRQLKPQVLKSEVAGLFKGEGFERNEVEVDVLEDLTRRVVSPLHTLEHGLQPWVAFAIMPIFALFNAGFTVGEGTSLTAPVPLAAFVGLLLGKPVGVVLSSWLAVKAGWCSLPEGVGWVAMLGTGLLAGIGFTMSLFIAALAFGDGVLLDGAKLGVFSASILAAVLGLGVLALGTRAVK
jgi:NhaA family Na+:H+ antiporter